jgi:hypothetical protein
MAAAAGSVAGSVAFGGWERSSFETALMMLFHASISSLYVLCCLPIKI